MLLLLCSAEYNYTVALLNLFDRAAVLFLYFLLVWQLLNSLIFINNRLKLASSLLCKIIQPGQCLLPYLIAEKGSTA